MTSALPSISPSMAVKYLTSTAFGSGLVESLTWAVAKSGVAANRIAATNKSARMRNSFWGAGVGVLVSSILALSSKPIWHLPKRRPPGGGLFSRDPMGTAGFLETHVFLETRVFLEAHAAHSTHAAAGRRRG